MAEDELIREIHEDLRRDRMEKMWREFGKHILGISLAVVVITIAIVLWQDHARKLNTQATSQYLEASFLLTHEKYDEAAKAFGEIRRKSSSELANMAAIRQAQALIALNKTDEAIAVLDKVARQHTADNAVRGLAGLMAAAAEAKKTGKMPDISNELQDVRNPFAYTAREFEALHLIDTGKKEEAASLLRSLAEDEKTPPSLRVRAEMIAGTLSVAKQ